MLFIILVLDIFTKIYNENLNILKLHLDKKILQKNFCYFKSCSLEIDEMSWPKRGKCFWFHKKLPKVLCSDEKISWKKILLFSPRAVLSHTEILWSKQSRYHTLRTNPQSTEHINRNERFFPRFPNLKKKLIWSIFVLRNGSNYSERSSEVLSLIRVFEW